MLFCYLRFLKGAWSIDQHFISAPYEKNIPVSAPCPNDIIFHQARDLYLPLDTARCSNNILMELYLWTNTLGSGWS